MNAPIALFAYNRPDHLTRTLAALQANRGAADSEIYCFSDGPKDDADAVPVAAVRRILHAIAGFGKVTVIEKERNEGLAASVIAGVGALLAQHGAVIVLEDDIETAPDFLDYLNGALDLYRDDPRIFSVSGYTAPIAIPPGYRHDIFLLPRASSWGWATWRDRWDRVDWAVGDRALLLDRTVRDAFDAAGTDLSDMLERWVAGRVDSWAIRFNWAHFRQGGLSVVPVISRTRSIGCDGSGSNLGTTGRYAVTLADGTQPVRFETGLTVDPAILARYRRFFDRSVRRRVKRFFRKMIGN